MADSEFNKTLVFRTGLAGADLTTTSIRSVQADEPLAAATSMGGRPMRRQPSPVAAVKLELAERFARLKLDFQTHEADAADQAKWSELEKQSRALDPDGAQHRHRLATILGDLACGRRLRRALRRPRSFRALGGAWRPQVDGVRNRLTDGRNNPEKCRGVAGLPRTTGANLEAIKPARTSEHR